MAVKTKIFSVCKYCLPTAEDFSVVRLVVAKFATTQNEIFSTCKDFLQVRQECAISIFERVGKMLFMATVANFATVQNEGGRNLI
ncbi:MAG: hypothetical protein J6T48_10440 [Bacteroidales bacterium]|nr:hypothetical protein [Bacteroidales bacterium]